jgi:hypothetical protein
LTANFTKYLAKFFFIHRLEKEKQLSKSEVDDAKAQTDAVSKAKVTILKKFSIININYKSILNEI